MRLSKLIKVQLVVFGLVALVAGGLMTFGYIQLPALLGIGRYSVTVHLAEAAGLYTHGNVTYRGTEVGQITDVRLTQTGVDAVLSLRSDVQIPANVDAQVHSVSGVGEQYVALEPRSSNGPALKNGDVIPANRTSVPPDINKLLDATNRGLQAIPRDNVKTVVDESFKAVGGLGPELSRLVKASTQLAIDAHNNLDPMITLIDKSGPVLRSQVSTSDAIQAWSSHLADLTRQLRNNDSAVAGLLEKGPAAAEQARQLIERLDPTLPVLLANLVSIDPVLITYQPALEQLLVLLPQGVADSQMATLSNRFTKHPGFNLDFNLNMNFPPPCTTGFLPAQQQRPPAVTDAPEVPQGDLYCRIPQDSPYTAVRGARNYPCLEKPGKRAPTAKMCESDEEYVPLNDGSNWKGDPNATLSGQGIPAVEAGTPQPPAGPPLAIANYDPTSGKYVGPDGHVYTQSDLTHNPKGKTWQSMLMPQPTN